MKFVPAHASLLIIALGASCFDPEVDDAGEASTSGTSTSSGVSTGDTFSGTMTSGGAGATTGGSDADAVPDESSSGSAESENDAGGSTGAEPGESGVTSSSGGDASDEGDSMGQVACEEGTYRSGRDVLDCLPWGSCGWAEVLMPGTPISDVQCNPTPVVKQFGAEGFDRVGSLETDSEEALYASGFPDAFLRKYNSTGELVWSRNVQGGGVTNARGVAVDSTNGIILVGDTQGEVDGANNGESDAYVCKYTSSGDVEWCRQFGSQDEERVYAVATDSTDQIVVVGSTNGRLLDVAASSVDAFVRVYSSGGAHRWSRQLAVSGDDVATDVAVDESDSIYIVGTAAGQLDGVVPDDDGDVFLRKYSLAGDVLWTRQFGSGSSNPAIALYGEEVFVSGSTTGVLGEENRGGRDAFVISFSSAGDIRWIQQFGSTRDDAAAAIAVDPSGLVLVAGQFDVPAVGDEVGPSDSAGDVFLSAFSVEGVLTYQESFGTLQEDQALALAVAGSRRVFVGGTTRGDWVQRNAGNTDAFIMQVLTSTFAE